ncbi:MAG: hypothetical protein OEP48_09785 [Betaproteobacteria bacterium]|nr:hypothetical protein [Betaproteobacteria bacterium]MDH3436223.1 hypothetical protein [Betaproteobacteria bacterium]
MPAPQARGAIPAARGQMITSSGANLGDDRKPVAPVCYDFGIP